MCKNCTCKKTIDFSEMARQLLTEFGQIMPNECRIFLENVESGVSVYVIKLRQKDYRLKYPLS